MKRPELERRSATRYALAVVMLIPALLGAGPGPSPGHMAFDRLGHAEGLSNSHVTSILQDREGFLWFGTADGLNRYDGYELRVFRHDPGDSTSVRGNWITGLREDARGDLWIILGIGGIDRFHRDSDTFEHVQSPAPAPHDPPDRPVVMTASEDAEGQIWLGSQRGLDWLSTEGDLARLDHHPLPGESDERRPVVTAIAAGRDGTLWIGTAGQGVFARDPEGHVSSLHTDGAAHVRVLIEDAAGRLWVGARSGIYTIERETSAATADGAPPARVAEWPRDAGVPRNRAPARMLEDGAGRIWVMFDGGSIARLDPGGTAFRRVEPPGRLLARRAAIGRHVVLLAAGDRVWFSSGGGLLVWDPTSDRLLDYPHDPTDPKSLPHNLVSALFEDRAGTLWIGTWGGGVAKLDERAVRFHRRRNPFGDPAMPSASSINALAVDRSGRLWLGTESGLYALDDADSGDDGATRRAPLIGGPIRSLLVDADGRLWVGRRKGLTIRVPEGDGAGRYLTPPKELTNVEVDVFYEDRTRRIWLGTTRGLWRLDPSGEVHTYPVGRDDPRALPSSQVSALCEDSDGALWVGTYIGGLSRLDVERGVFEHFLPTDDDTPTNASINSKSVTDLLEDSRGRLWIGTYSGGLNLFDRDRHVFEHITSADGLAGMRVAGILEDDDGRLWLSTNAGITRFDPDARTFMSFDVDDGLQANEFNVGARHRALDGTLLFGGINGFNVFRPDEIRENEVLPPVVLTALRVMDRPARLADVRGSEHDIELPHDRNFIAFEFASLDFTNPKKNRYAYRLEGLDPDWILAGSRRYAAYTELDPGEYVFRVRGSNADGLWNEAGLALSIRIVPPFWRTSWFTALAVCTLALGALTTHRTITRRRIAQTLALERVRVAEREHVREEVSRDYHDELGARLTKISLFTELIRRKMVGERRDPGATEDGGIAAPPVASNIMTYVEKVAQSAEILSRESRDFIWALNPANDSLLDVAHYLQEFGADLFEETPVSFSVEGLDAGLSELRLDMRWKRQVTLLVKEALANCMRHSRATNAALGFLVSGTHVTITIADDGTGTTPALGENGAGSGLGNMRARAAEIGGEISIEATPGRGTRVVLTAPLPEQD